MREFQNFHGLGVFLAAALLAGLAWGETLEMVTYYPAPAAEGGAGDFDRLHANRATIGEEYNRTNVPDADVPDGHLFVFDRVGIGTTDPVGPLHVVGVDDTDSSVLFLPGADTGAPGIPWIRMGIGTATPAGQLHLYSIGNASIIADVPGTDPGQMVHLNFITKGDGINTLNNPATLGWHLAARGNAWGTAEHRNDLGLWYWDGTTFSAGSPSMFWDSVTRRVGIGTEAPGYPLHIRDTDAGHTALMLDSTNPATWLAFKNDTSAAPYPLIGIDTGQQFEIQVGGSGRLMIFPNGRVGIGTGGPISALTVVGAYNSSGGASGGSDYRTLLLENSRSQDTNSRFIDCIRRGTGDSEFIVYNNGAVLSDGGFTGPADYAEWLETLDADLAPGELVSLDPGHPNHVRRTKEPNDPWLFGIISTRPGVLGTRAEDVTEASESREKDPRWKKVAFLGQVPTKVTGDVAIGDGITASFLPGVGMRAGPGDPVVAVALEPHQGAQEGLINCSVVPNGGRFQAGILKRLEEQQAQIQELREEILTLREGQ